MATLKKIKVKDPRRQQFNEYADKLGKIDLDALFERMNIEGQYSFKKLIPIIKRLASLFKDLKSRSFENLPDDAVGTIAHQEIVLVGRINEIETFLQGKYHNGVQQDYGFIVRHTEILDKEVTEKIMPQLQYLNLETNGLNGSKTEKGTDLWSIIHSKIIKVSKKKLEDGHFADAVESAFKEVNNRIKKYYKSKIGQELDGADLMYKAFSGNSPVIPLDDLSTETGKNIQQGYMQIFAGSMIGIRNPKAHNNLIISKSRAIHLIFVASLLMGKLDEAGVPK